MIGVFILATLGFAASIFALYKQQSYNQATKLLQSKLDTQTKKLDEQAEVITGLKAKQISQRNEVNQALKANQLNQVQLSLIKWSLNSIEIIDALINSQLAEKIIIDAKNTLLKHQRVLSSSIIDEVLQQSFIRAISLRDLNEIWQSVPGTHQLSLTTEYYYFKRLYGFVPQTEFKECMQKRLLTSFDKKLIVLYLDLSKDDNASYEFVRSCWLKQRKQNDQSLNIVVINFALIYPDDEFVAANLHKVHESALTVSEQLKYLLAKERLADKQSMPNQAQTYRVLGEKLLLERL